MWPEQIGGMAIRAEVGRTDARLRQGKPGKGGKGESDVGSIEETFRRNPVGPNVAPTQPTLMGRDQEAIGGCRRPGPRLVGCSAFSSAPVPSARPRALLAWPGACQRLLTPRCR